MRLFPSPAVGWCTSSCCSFSSAGRKRATRETKKALLLEVGPGEPFVEAGAIDDEALQILGVGGIEVQLEDRHHQRVLHDVELDLGVFLLALGLIELGLGIIEHGVEGFIWPEVPG